MRHVIKRKRREIAIVYLRNVLNRAKQFTTAMDIPAKPPVSLRMLLVAGDSEETNKTVQYDSKGGLSVIETGSGDGTVLRSRQFDQYAGFGLIVKSF